MLVEGVEDRNTWRTMYCSGCGSCRVRDFVCEWPEGGRKERDVCEVRRRGEDATSGTVTGGLVVSIISGVEKVDPYGHSRVEASTIGITRRS